jgi:predicted Zn-dependent protease
VGKEHLFDLTVHGSSKLSGQEVLLAHFTGERTDFVRWNGARVRQPMTVRQGHLALSLIDGLRRDTTTISLSGDRREDHGRVAEAISSMRAGLPMLPEDPYLLYSMEPRVLERVDRGRLPEPREAVDAILSIGKGTDLVGIYASGSTFRGFASSLGHRLWHEVDSFQFDWSLYHAADKAVQSSYSTSHWNETELRTRMEAAGDALAHLTRPPKTIEPGSYRTYLTPPALAELVALFNFGGVSAKAQRTKTSCLEKLVEGTARLSPKLTLRENIAEGLAPAFDEVGFLKPDSVDLVVAGRHAGALVGPRTAREYSLTANADAEEALRSADVEAGTLEAKDALTALDTGVYVGNLWYLNFSDRTNARVTGMTRFATFWVEGGRIVAPLNVMRFDDSLYRILGDGLLELSRERDWILSTSTYDRRSVETSRLPGALLRELTFTL